MIDIDDPGLSTILVVDDNPAALYVKSWLLCRRGYRVLEAASGTEALTIAKAALPDLTLLDTTLSDISGFDVCHRLKTAPETRFIKVLQTSTARISAPDRVKSLEMGADAYLVEPVEEEELIGTVRALLRLRQQEQANRHLIEKLSQTERRLLEATEAANCAMWDWDIQSGRLEWFGAHERLAGMRPGGFSGKIKAFTDILHPNDRERVWEKVQALMARRESQFADEYRFIHPDGTVRWMSGTGRFYYDAIGQAVRMTGVAQDITERKQALEALSGAEHRYRIIFEQAGVGVAQIDSQTGRFERVNRKYCEIVGRTESELLATTYMSLTHPDDLDEELAAVERLRGGLVDSFAMEKRYVRKDESIVWVLCNVAPLWQPGEGATHHIDVIQDITDRKQAQAELERMRYQLAEGQRIANLGSWEYIAATQTMVWSDEEKRIYGLDPSQPSPDYDTMLRRYTHPDDAAELDRRIRVTLRDGVPFENENRIIRSDGSIRWIYNKALPYFNAAGKPVKYVGTTLDITQRKEAEIVLAAAKDQLQATLTASDIGTWRWDLTRNDLVTDINLKRLFSIGEGDEVPLERYVERIVPDDRDRIKRAIESAIREGGAYEEQFRVAGPDGTVRWIHARGKVERDERGTARSFPGVVLDITERKHAEDQLRESEARFRTMAEAVPSFLFETDAAGWNTWTSKGWCRFTGQTPEEVAGHGWAEALHPEERAANLDQWLRCMEKGIPFESQQRLRRADGRYAWVIARALPVRDDQGTIRRWVGSVTDVDAIVRAEEEQTRLAAIVGSTTDAIIGKDLQGTITSWNKGAENVLGYTAQEAIGRSVTMLFPPDRAREEQLILDRLRKGESIERYETVRRRRDGQDISVSLTISPIRDPQGRIVGASKILRDITERKMIEAELERIRHILAEGQRIAHLGSWEYISATQEMVWSDEEKRIYGLDPAGPSPAYEEMLRHHIHPEDAAELDRSFRKAFQSRDVFENETRVIRPDGSVRWIYNRAHPYFDSDGRLVKYIGATLDITERKRVEEQLRESHRFISEMTSVLPGVLYIFDLQEQRNVYVNRHTASVLGYSAEEVHTLGADFIPTVLHPDDAIRLLQHFESLKELEDGNTAQVEYRFRHRDRSYRWFLSRDVVWQRAPDGSVRQVLGIATDISGQKQVEEQLRRSEQRLQRVLETDAVGVLFFDPTGTLIQANDVFLRMTGYTREQVERRELTWRRMTPPEWFEASEAQLAQFARTGRIGPYETEYFLADGSRRWMLVAGRDLGDGTIAEYCVDLHDRKQAEQELREAQQRLQRWNVELEQAVRLKTAELHQSQDRLRALTSELNLAEQRERRRLATELHDHLQQLLVFGKLTIGQGKRVAGGVPAWATVLTKVDDILSEALTYSRTLVAELSPPVLRDHGLTASLKWLADYMKHKHEHTVTVVVPDEPELTLPEDQVILLFQSARELLINSAKHAGTGRATLTMDQRADRLCITVRDEGKGFEPAAARPLSGGLSSKFGLYSIEERMRAMGGAFTIESAPGHGTTATLSLPLARSVEDQAPPTGELSRVTGGSHTDDVLRDPLHDQRPTIRVVLVDDHAMVRQGLRSVLDAYADIHVIGEARDGIEAVNLVEQHRPRVVVMDLNMPRMNGIEATEHIMRRYPDTIVIGISVNMGDDNSAAMQRAGAATLLTKEAAVEQLHETIVQEVVKHG